MHGLLNVNMQIILDKVDSDYSQLQLSDITTLEGRCSTWDAALSAQQNFAIFDKAYSMLAANDAATGNHKKLINAQYALRHSPHFTRLLETWLLQNINVAGQTYASLKEFLLRADLILPAPITPTAQQFLAASIADPSNVANAAIDARLKALEDENKRLKAGDKRKKKAKSPAAPAASTTAAANPKDILPCGMCGLWNRHDPIQHPDILLWGKCKRHNPVAVP